MASQEATYYSHVYVISSQALVPKISLFVPAPLILLPWYATTMGFARFSSGCLPDIKRHRAHSEDFRRSPAVVAPSFTAR